MAILTLDSKYWQNEIDKTEISIAELINDETVSAKTSKTDEDNLILQDLDKVMSEKRKYISYCKVRLQEELNKESKIEKPSILFVPREFGY